jgi:hypothetical protein
MVETTASPFIPFLAELYNGLLSELITPGRASLVLNSPVRRHYDIPIALGYISLRKLGHNQHNHECRQLVQKLQLLFFHTADFQGLDLQWLLQLWFESDARV